MHHLIYPSQDTYITNRPNELDTKNFGVDEILQVGTDNHLLAYVSSTKDYTYSSSIFSDSGVEFFNGSFTGSISGTNATTSYAQLTGSINGLYTGSFFIPTFSGSIKSGSFICLFGTASGVDTRSERNRQYITESYADRALLQFDLTAISNSIVDGTITNPTFHLKVKVCNEFQLPIDYTIYCYPVSESWVMGDGYMSDEGSDSGASWTYRDSNYGTEWATRGGSYINTPTTQSFHYKSADIDMDVTSIVNLWLMGNPNYGFILLSSDELVPTGSGFVIKYFSEDTNTIYSPVLDVRWNDWSFSTGSLLTASVTITSASGSNSDVVWQSSSLNGGSGAGGLNGSGATNGVHGNFKGASFFTIHEFFVTASNALLTSSFVEEFTGSFTGQFYGIISGSGYFTGSGGFSASFTGSIDGTASINLTGSNITGTNVAGYIVGDAMMPSVLGTYTGNITSSTVYFYGTASGHYLDPTWNAFVGFISASGFTGTINGVPVIGPVEGLISKGDYTVNLPQEIHYLSATSPMESPYANANVSALFPGTTNPYTYINLEYVWGGDEVGWTSTVSVPANAVMTSSCGASHSVQILSGSFTSGPFGGDQFTAYYENYKILYGGLTGDWSSASLQGASVVIPLPQITYPYVTAFINGPYISARALGLYNTSGSTSASFNGQIVDGPMVGDYVSFQLSGSYAGQTSSFSYTSSIQMTSSFLDPIDPGRLFSINLQNLQPTYKAGDIVKINVFARPKFPVKDFAISTQQQAYLVPKFLPTSSYWALKDNQTEEIVINFDSYTRISCGFPEGNFFLVDTTSLPQERYYRILIRVDDGVQVNTFDTGKTFKITR